MNALTGRRGPLPLRVYAMKVRPVFGVDTEHEPAIRPTWTRLVLAVDVQDAVNKVNDAIRDAPSPWGERYPFTGLLIDEARTASGEIDHV